MILEVIVLKCQIQYEKGDIYNISDTSNIEVSEPNTDTTSGFR